MNDAIFFVIMMAICTFYMLFIDLLGTTKIPLFYTNMGVLSAFVTLFMAAKGVTNFSVWTYSPEEKQLLLDREHMFEERFKGFFKRLFAKARRKTG